MPTIAAQLRADRQRRERRRQVVIGVLVATLLVALGVELVAGARSDASGATSIDTVPLTAPTTAATTTSSVVTGLDPGLERAFERAEAAAAEAGHELEINSGFRTAEEQAALLHEEIEERGLTEALWWVFPPERSMHVQGLAIDVGDGPAADWLANHGARFGLCRTLDWEWWHFEWRARWEASRSCPDPARTPDEAPGVS